MRKGIVGVGLAVALTGVVATPAITAVPVAAYAEETFVEVADAAAFQEALALGKSVKLTANITGSVTVPESANVTIDLNGYTITATAKWGAITNNGTLVVKGAGTVDGSNLGGTAALYNAPGATATLNGGAFTGSKWYVIKNLGKLTIDGATVDQKDSGSSAIDNGWYGHTSNDCGLLYPSSGTVESLGVSLDIKSGTFTGGMNVVKNDDYSKLDISGGTFTNTNGPAVLNWSVATISDGEFSVKDDASGVIANGSYNNEADKGELTITGGTFTAPKDGTGAVIACGNGGKDGGSVTLDGGTYKGDFSGTKASGVTASIGEGVKLSDLNTLKSAASYMGNLAVETADGNTFTVKAMETARDESTRLIECEFVSGTTTAIYFSGDNAEKNADEFIGGNDADGDGINDALGSAVKAADVSKVTIHVRYVTDEDGTETEEVSSQQLTQTELNAKQISLDISKLQQTKPEREGYAFARWTAYLIDDLDDEKTTLQDVEGTVLEVPFTEEDLSQYVQNVDGTVDVDVLFFPSWYAPVCFTFDTNGGEPLNDERKATDSNGLVTIDKESDLPTPVREGYTFKGWEEYALNEDTDEAEWTLIEHYPYIVGQDNSGNELKITLRAKWAENEFKDGVIKFDSNGGSAVESVTRPVVDQKTGMVTINSALLKSKVPTREGYTFVGWEDVDKKLDGTKEGLWKDNIVFAGEKYGDAADIFYVTKSDNVLTLKAVWKKNAETPSNDSTSNNTTVKTTVTTVTSKDEDTKAAATKAKAKVLPATGDSAAAAVAVIAGAGAVVAAAGAASKRRNNE